MAIYCSVEDASTAAQFEASPGDVLYDDEDPVTDEDLSVPLTAGFRSLKHLFGYITPAI